MRSNDSNATIAGQRVHHRRRPPTLLGPLSAAPSADQVVRVLRDGTPFVRHGCGRRHDLGRPPTAVPATARTHLHRAHRAGSARRRAVSTGYTFTIDTVARAQTANVTQIADDISGNLAEGAAAERHHTRRVAAQLRATLGANESLQLLRNQAAAAARGDQRDRDPLDFHRAARVLAAGTLTATPARVVDRARATPSARRAARCAAW